MQNKFAAILASELCVSEKVNKKNFAIRNIRSNLNRGHDNAILLPGRTGVRDPVACLFDLTFRYLVVLAADDRLRPLLLRNLARGMRMRCLYAGMGTDLISGLSIEQAADELRLLDADKPFFQCLEVMIS